MRSKARQRGTSMPEVNLVPMMDVIMTILTFFIIVSMTLTNFQSVDVALPTAQSGVNRERPVDPMIVGLNQQQQILLQGNPATREQLAQAIQTYLVQNPKGSVVLKADQGLPYQQVIRVLATLKEVGGDSVSLAIE
ncbi:biopolymer transport protein ExbD [Leptolyngbya boryana NIES-2135]|jgi:biopolymer transport protein ExbD|uniref:Biopolymer transport protein ExbD n=1 Tax=Leptolyngbya boryana NIES-2135 TaxID=1973484 RepID=A0A1Z4JC88_LEPBY|nr:MULTISPECIES: biopolymer transporter ExbD [Leptolyngbya]BAY54351.1 biopolymer transport protein ExbD [Leptolyngbya boryana NIES-2135]MBD2370140.1 biopolymer transporter ExbD [Leptolyngbya sp. FACHB-161]MBD2376393.1 biopolymer transporter ExbD [Leptolyngbya sp. FACHB-238]MBD2400667.1 biopolymer transporter ExbD [Leptolyngbya sp. FACHB-239]MBD2407210.1 biopolymer transporter ExbD [Leptolyngbya sp. FACHB-402]